MAVPPANIENRLSTMLSHTHSSAAADISPTGDYRRGESGRFIHKMQIEERGVPLIIAALYINSTYDIISVECLRFRHITVDLNTSGSGGMAFQGLLYTASYDHLSIPLLLRDNTSMVSLNPDLLEEVKNVLIPADMLRIEDCQIIGKGEPAHFLLVCFLLPLGGCKKVNDNHSISFRALWDGLSWIPDRQ